METSDRGVLDVERFDLGPGPADLPRSARRHGLVKVGGSDARRRRAPYVIRLDRSSRGIVAGRGVAASRWARRSPGWPQLGSEITLGAATVAAAVRRIGLAGELPSGRVRFDVEEISRGPRTGRGRPEAEADLFTPPPEDPPLVSDDPIELIVDAARRAPSGGNVQPWRFEADDEEVRFFMLARADVGDGRGASRHLRRASGAAFFNARVQASSLTKLGPVKLFPGGSPVAPRRLDEAGNHFGRRGDHADARLSPQSARRTAAWDQPTVIDPEMLQALDRAASSAKGPAFAS